jgi:hypothetical protein
MVYVTLPDTSTRDQVEADLKTSIAFGKSRVRWMYTVSAKDPE